ncbi:hypothetical protein AbraIFM66950_004945 [Aspergillus brasiliensis]|nr:hypothetical protein AbraIFM66950_004945 [Aspergillus brasiliensis]
MTRKRKVIKEDENEEEQGAQILSDAMKDSLQKAFLGTALLDVRELDEHWESPYPNRELDWTHVKKLEDTYRHGIKHTAPDCRMRVSITLADWKGLLDAMAEELNKSNSTLIPPTAEHVISKWSEKAIADIAYNGLASLRFRNQHVQDLTLLPTESHYYNFTLDAGQHRKYALLNLIKQMALRKKEFDELPADQKATATEMPPEVSQQVRNSA